jgi:hypothetical protein
MTSIAALSVHSTVDWSGTVLIGTAGYVSGQLSSVLVDAFPALGSNCPFK